ncbi:hypothetical protein ABK040_012611 [Willaertia magna]
MLSDRDYQKPTTTQSSSETGHSSNNNSCCSLLCSTCNEIIATNNDEFHEFKVVIKEVPNDRYVEESKSSKTIVRTKVNKYIVLVGTKPKMNVKQEQVVEVNLNEKGQKRLPNLLCKNGHKVGYLAERGVALTKEKYIMDFYCCSVKDREGKICEAKKWKDREENYKDYIYQANDFKKIDPPQSKQTNSLFDVFNTNRSSHFRKFQDNHTIRKERWRSGPFEKNDSEPYSHQKEIIKKKNENIRGKPVASITQLEGVLNRLLQSSERYVDLFGDDVFKGLFSFDGFLSTVPLNLLTIEKVLKRFTDENLDESPMKTKISNTFSSLLNSPFYFKYIPFYIRNGIQEDKHFELICKLFENCLKYCYFEASRLFLSELEEKLNHLQFQEDVYLKLKERMANLKNKQKQAEKALIRKETNQDTNGDQDYDMEDLSCFSILPRKEELIQNDNRIKKRKLDVPKNIIDKEYDTVSQYLTTQFLLEREDFIQPFKEGISSYLSKDFNPKDISVYVDVKFKLPEATRQGFTYPLTFSFPWRKLNWQITKKLTFGSLLCLFPQLEKKSNNFYDFDRNVDPIYVTVHDRKDISNGVISVVCCNGEDMKKIDIGKIYLMFESPVYYNSISPVLKAIQETNEDNLAFKKILVDLDKQEMPKYIANNPKVPIKCILKQELKEKYSDTAVDVSKTWLPDDYSLLDSSQNKSVHHALTNEIAIIQGPPGTGKTFTGLAIVKILLEYAKNINRPIVCITYTNHALDQFLEGLIDSVPDFVRIGGRSRSENQTLKDRNIRDLRYKDMYTTKEYDRQIHSIASQIRNIHLLLKDERNLLYTICQTYLPNLIREISTKLPIILLDKEEMYNTRKKFEIWLEEDEKRRMDVYKKKLKNGGQFYSNRRNAFAVLNEEDEEDEEEVEYVYEMEQVPIEQSSRQGKEENNNTQDYDENEEVKPKNAFALLEEDEEDEEDALDNQIIKEDIQNEEDELRENENDFDDTNFTNVTSSNPFPDLSRIVKENKLKSDILITFIKETEILKRYLMKIRNPYVLKRRKQLFQNLLNHFKQFLGELLGRLYTKINNIYNMKKEAIEQIDYKIVSKCKLVGLTSTAAAMHRNLLQRVKAPIYIIEEAAELLECQILATLHKEVQHLIMIGDEKQLRPKVNTYTLEKDHNFAISLFERMVMNNMECQVLTLQQRMRPEVRYLVDGFYDQLIDHDRVKAYGDVEGVGMNVCFITHNEPENQRDEIQSKSHPFEAEFAVKLSKYLVNTRKHKSSQITILTPYKGQYFLIKRKLAQLLREDIFKNIRVSTIDDFQGEENDIIIASLVRSNENNALGFVAIQNRIIVTLSRAKKGLYIIGNSELLSQDNDWYQVINKLRGRNQIVESLPLCCPRHKDKVHNVTIPNDFDDVIHGGCVQPCAYRYECGHLCDLKCHDPSIHEERKCSKTCGKEITKCGHRCKENCHFGKQCPSCTEVINYKFNDCDHVKRIKCGSKDLPQECVAKCEKQLSCGHKCTKTCCDCKLNGCGSCTTLVESFCNICNRTFKHECGDNNPKCNNTCDCVLTCGHPCKGKCSDCNTLKSHKECEFDCERTLICGHLCSTKHSCKEPCPGCILPCERVCFCGVQCDHQCKEICTPCLESCTIGCKHVKCQKICHETCDVTLCEKRCEKVCLKCKEQCRGICGEDCPPCLKCNSTNKEEEPWECSISLCGYEDLSKDDLVYVLPECGHIFELTSLDNFFNVTNSETIQYFKCPACRSPIFTAKRYQRQIKKSLQLMDSLKEKIKKLKEQEEKRNALAVIRAVSREANYASGHWYYCINGHPYFIGECGRAMQVSFCVDCGARIGGMGHQLDSTNSRAENIETALSNNDFEELE